MQAVPRTAFRLRDGRSGAGDEVPEARHPPHAAAITLHVDRSSADPDAVIDLAVETFAEIAAESIGHQDAACCAARCQRARNGPGRHMPTPISPEIEIATGQLSPTSMLVIRTSVQDHGKEAGDPSDGFSNVPRARLGDPMGMEVGTHV